MNTRLRTLLIIMMVTQITSIADATPIYLMQWGSYGVGAGQFDQPYDMALDAEGNLLVTDNDNDRIQKFDPSGNYLMEWGGLGGEIGKLSEPAGIAIDRDGLIYVVEERNHRIQKFSSTGTPLATWGQQGAGPGQFYHPYGIAVDSNGDIYVSDLGNHRIQKFSPEGTFLAEWGSWGQEPGEFGGPAGLAVDAADNLFVVERERHRVQVFDANQQHLGDWGRWGDAPGEFRSPVGIEGTSNGILYVAETTGQRVQKFTSSGAYIEQWGRRGPGPGQVDEVHAVVASAKGEVYLASKDNRISKWFDVDALQSQEVADLNALTLYSDPELGSTLTVPSGKRISVSTKLQIEPGASLHLAGGQLSTFLLANSGDLLFSSGHLGVLGTSGLSIGTSGQLSSLTVAHDMFLDVAHVLSVNTGGDFEISDGSISAQTLAINGGYVRASKLTGIGRLELSSGSLAITGNNSPVRVLGTAAGVISAQGDIHLGDSGFFNAYDHQGTLEVGEHVVTLNAGGFANLGSVTSINGGMLIARNGITLGVGDNLIGTGKVDGRVAQAFGSTIAALGDLEIGDVASFAGFASDGELQVRSATVTIWDRDRAVLGTLTTIGDGADDGTLNVPNGVVLEEGKTIVGRGSLNGRITQSFGSLIVADGDFVLGDPASTSGLVSAGELDVGAHTVTVRDADRAVLGSLTSLGAGEAMGLVIADKGMLLPRGSVLSGKGVIRTPQGQFENRGLVDGVLTFADSVIGDGNYQGHVTFGKGFGTGDLASSVAFQDVTFLESATLQLKIGGVARGTGYDSLDVTGVATLGGALSVSLVDWGAGVYVPKANDSFVVLVGATTRQFDDDGSLIPQLRNDLTWQVDYSDAGVTLNVVTPYSADFNGDGQVAGDDLGYWLDALTLSGFGEADADQDGDTDGADFLAWQREFGSGVPESTTSSIPEPQGIPVIISLGIQGLLFRARRGGERPLDPQLRQRSVRVGWFSQRQASRRPKSGFVQ